MLKVSRILKGYDSAGSVNSLLAPWGFVDEETFLTKAGHVGIVYRIDGADYERLDASQRRDIVHRFEAALRLLPSPHWVRKSRFSRRTSCEAIWLGSSSAPTTCT